MLRNYLSIIILLFSGAVQAVDYTPIHSDKPVKKVAKKTTIVIEKKCSGNVVELFTTSTGASFQWEDANGPITGATSNTYRPTVAGTYTLRVDSEVSNSITLNFATPTASFTHDATNNACGVETVTFTNTSSNGDTYLWEFGDGTTSTDENPVHEFKANFGDGNQSFTVKLTVTSGGCKISSTSQSVIIKQIPDAKLGGTGSYTYDGKPYFRACSNNSSAFNFTNQSTTNSINTNYKIDWGDGSPVFEGTIFNTTSHTYNKGIYSLTYTVTGKNGCVTTIIYTVFVGGNPAVGLGNPGNTSICTGQTLEFPITLTENNPIGTTYTIRFNDGSEPIVLQHPLPPDYKIVHTFTKSSCGTTSYNGTTPYPNAFALFIEASNPCDKSGASVVPIYVSDKPKASFTIDKGKTICENTTLKFTSTSKGNTASSSGCQIGKLIWVVEPLSGTSSAGYSTTSNLGDDYGFLTDPGSWLNGANSIDILFKTAGRYRVSLKVAAEAGGGSCGPDLYSEEICVNPKPTATFTLPVTAGCAPFTVKPTNTSSAPNCGINTYKWTVTPVVGTDCDITTTQPTYLNGTSSTSETPEFRFSNPGKYRIVLETSSGTSCTTTSVYQEVIVKAPPTAVISTSIPASICEDGSINPTALVKNCFSTNSATYEWEFLGSTTTSSTSATPTNIVYPTKGTYTIRLRVSNECGSSAWVTRTITVIEKPVLVDKANITVCNGTPVSAIVFGTSTTGVATYTWNNDNINIGLSGTGNGNLPAFTARNTSSSPILATITVTPKASSGGGCLGDAKTFTITVNPGVSAANAGTAQNLCDVTSTVLDGSEAPLGGEWSVVSGTGTSFADKNDSKTMVTGLQAGQTYKFRWTVKGYDPCPTTSNDVIVTVAPATVGGTTSGAKQYCGTSTAGTVTLSGHVGNVVRWEQSLDGNSWTTYTSSNTTTTLNYTALTSTTYYRAVVKSGTCSEAFSTSTKIEIKPVPAKPIANTSYTYCLNSVATQLTATGTDLKWYSGTMLLTEAPTPATNIATSLTYYVTQTVDDCESDRTEVKVIINPSISNNNISADQTICKNGTPTALKNSGLPLSGGTATFTYQWQYGTDGTTFADILNATALTYQPGALAEGTYYRRIVRSGTCESTSNVIKITVQGTLENTNIGVNQTICYNTVPAKLIGEVSLGGSGTFTYKWEQSTTSASTGFSEIIGATDVDYQPSSLTQTTYYKRTVTSGSCNAVSDVITLTVIPQFNLTSILDVVACNQFSQGIIPFSIDKMLSNITYTWENDNTAIGLAASGTGNLPAFSTVNTTKLPLIATITYKVSYNEEALTCLATRRTFTYTVLPKINVTSILNNLTFCKGQNTTTITLASDADAYVGSSVKYRWTSSQIIGLTNGEGLSIPSFTAVNNGNSPITDIITVVPIYTYAGQSCEGTPVNFQVTVNPAATTTFSIANQTICSNSTTSLVELNSITPNVVFSWSAQAVAGITGLETSGTNEIPVQTLVNITNAPITVVFKAKATTQGDAVCDGVEAEYRITVNPIPEVSATTNNKTICNNQNTSLALSSNVIGTQFSWTVTTNPNITGAIDGSGSVIDQILVNTSATPQTVTYHVSPLFQNGSAACNGDVLEINITVSPSPVVTFSTNDLTLCSAQTSPVVTLSSNTPNAQISWTVNIPVGITGIGTLAGTTNIPAETLVNTTNVPLIVTYKALAKTDDVNACAGTVVEYRVTVNPVAKVTNTSLKQQVCSGGNSVPVVLQSNVVAANFSWTATASSAEVTGFMVSGNGNIPAQTLLNGSTQIQKIIYQIKTNAYGCDGETATYEIDIYPSPIFTSNTAKTEICSGKTFIYTPVSSTIGVTFKWTRAAVIGISNVAAGGSGIDAAAGISEVLINTTVNPIDVVYEYEMMVGGCTTGIKIPIVVTVNPQVTANFGLSAVNGCAPFNLVVRNLNSRALVSTYIVDFGDGSPLVTYTDTRDITHTYENDTKLVKLFYITITTRNECGEQISRPYEIRVQPQTVFSKLVLDATQTFGCTPFVVNFTAANQSTGANLYTWDFGDGSPVRQTTSLNENLIHTFILPGTYTVSLSATNGCSTVITTEEITVYPQVTANFNINKPQDCVGNEFSFTNLSAAAFTALWDFGDGTTSTELNPKHIYATSGIKTITLKSTQVYPNGGTCTAVITKTVQVLAAPDANFNTNVSTLNCGPFILQVRAIGSNTTNVVWDFGDATSSTNTAVGLMASHTYTKAGDYIVTAKAYNVQGCTSVSTQLIRVAESPVAAFTPAVSEVCGTSATIKLTNNTAYGGIDVVTYKWWVDGILVANQKDLEYNFVVPNSASLPYQFSVKLEASNVVGCKTLVEKAVHFNPFPKAIFSVVQNKNCAPFALQINNQSTNADQYEWYLDGTLVSTVKNPNDIVLNDFDKVYSLKLLVKNRYGCAESEQITQVATYPYLKADFDVANDLSCNGILDVQITNKSIGATSFSWDYGDGTPVYVGNNPTHSYGRAGVYHLKLTVNNGFCTDVYIKTITISNAPRASFLSDVRNGCNQLTVKFRNTSINASEYLWDFGDGTFSKEENPEHQYVHANNAYTVKLKVTNQYGCTDEIISDNFINVFPPPQALIEIGPNKIIKVPDYNFKFKAVTTEDIISYRWDFGDGSSSNRSELTHKYERYGTYRVKLYITNRANCTNVIEDEVTILDFPGYLYIPNAFEPDNLNNDLKVFKVKGGGLAIYQLKIFNKWGQLVWQTNKLDDEGIPTEHWDGMSKGQLLPLGAYYWQAEATYINGGVWKGMKYGNKLESKTGVIHLIR